MIRLSLIAIAVIFSSSANAAPTTGTATLAAPAEIARIVTETGSWRCSGTRCDGLADSMTNIGVAACTAVADRAGRVVAFTAGETAFGDAELKRCNRHIKG
jgi:hypothetical protein